MRWTALLLLAAVLTAANSVAFQADLSGEYSKLLPAQKRLLDQWVAEFNKISGQKRTPQELYDNAPVSLRTTFEGVTHALNRSTLTSADGAQLGTTLDLIDHLETVRGQVSGAGGDEQFRLYATLKPGAVQTLEKSKEFERGSDNTVFHHGYPTSYRLKGGLPSIQISVALDGKGCDIDVDYRSSKIPASLVNGHLSSSNSDVRAGGNYQKHTNRWQGLPNWWAAWFGAGPAPELDSDRGESADLIVTDPPKAAKGKMAEALNEFFYSWLVEKKPGLAIAYFSPRSYSCDIGMHNEEDGPPPNRGMIPIRILKQMHAANQAFPNLKSVGEMVESVPLDLPTLRLAPDQGDALFKVYQVRDDAAVRFECDYKYGFAEAPKAKEKFSDTYGTAVRFKTPKSKAGIFYFTWRKEKAGWRIVSYETEASMVKHDVPDLRSKTSPAPAKVEAFAGDPALVQAARGFMETLLLKHNVSQAMKSFSTRAAACFGIYSEIVPAAGMTDAEKLKKIEGAFSTALARLGRRPAMTDYAKGIPQWQPYARPVSHKDEQAFGIFAVPDAVGQATECTIRDKSGRMNLKQPIEPQYGNFYTSVFKFRVPGEDPAVLFLVWAKEGGAWKIISYVLETP